MFIYLCLIAFHQDIGPSANIVCCKLHWKTLANTNFCTREMEFVDNTNHKFWVRVCVASINCKSIPFCLGAWSSPFQHFGSFPISLCQIPHSSSSRWYLFLPLSKFWIFCCCRSLKSIDSLETIMMQLICPWDGYLKILFKCLHYSCFLLK